MNNGLSHNGDFFQVGEEPLVAPGVRAMVFDTPNGLYIPFIAAETEGAGDVGRYLGTLPLHRRVVFPTVLSQRLRGMLLRRGFRDGVEFEKAVGEHVEILERLPLGAT